jgi:hypothetical protein
MVLYLHAIRSCLEGLSFCFQPMGNAFMVDLKRREHNGSF